MINYVSIISLRRTDLEKSRLTENGVRIFSYENSKINSFAISLYVRGGVMYESDKENGFAHFFEHTAFRNINALMDGRLYEELDLHGLYFNAATYVNYIEFTITGAPKHFRTAASIISKVLCPFVITDKELDTERKRIKAEIREERESSLSRFSDEAVYRGCPLSRPIAGKCKSVDSFGIRTLKTKQPQLISSDNVFFYVGGAITEDDVNMLCKEVERYDVSSSSPALKECPLPTDFGKRNAHVTVKNSPTTSVKLSFDVDVTGRTVAQLFYLCDLLFTGESCPAYRELSENSGLVYSYEESIAYYGSFAVLSISFDVRADKLQKSLETALKIFADAKGKLGKRIPFIRAVYEDNVFIAEDDSENIVSEFGYYNHILGLDLTTIDKRQKCFLTVGEEEINELAEKVFTKDNLVIAIKGNKKNIDSERIQSTAARILG